MSRANVMAQDLVIPCNIDEDRGGVWMVPLLTTKIFSPLPSLT
jgi:hypothetical protein